MIGWNESYNWTYEQFKKVVITSLEIDVVIEKLLRYGNKICIWPGGVHEKLFEEIILQTQHGEN